MRLSKGFVLHHEGHEEHEVLEDVTLQPVCQSLHIEIDQKALLNAGKRHVCQQLGSVNRFHSGNAH